MANKFVVFDLATGMYKTVNPTADSLDIKQVNLNPGSGVAPFTIDAGSLTNGKAEIVTGLNAEFVNGKKVDDGQAASTDYLWTSSKIESWVLDNLNQLDAQESVIEALTSDSGITGQTTGDRYLVNGTGADGFVGLDNTIVVWNGSSWDAAVTSEVGMTTYDETNGITYIYNNAGSWVTLSASGNHNQLGDLQGGNGSDEYYHLNATNYNNLIGGGYISEHKHELSEVENTNSINLTWSGTALSAALNLDAANNQGISHSIGASGLSSIIVLDSSTSDGVTMSVSSAGLAVAVNVDDTTLTIDTDVVKVKDLGIDTAQLAAAAVTNEKLANGSVNAAKLDAAALITPSNSIQLESNILKVKFGTTADADVAWSGEKINTEITNAVASAVASVDYVQAEVDDYAEDTPAAPADGERYIVGGISSGAWLSDGASEGDIATYVDGTTGWTYYTPEVGDIAKLSISGSDDINYQMIYYTGATNGWVAMFDEYTKDQIYASRPVQGFITSDVAATTKTTGSRWILNLGVAPSGTTNFADADADGIIVISDGAEGWIVSADDNPYAGVQKEGTYVPVLEENNVYLFNGTTWDPLASTAVADLVSGWASNASELHNHLAVGTVNEAISQYDVIAIDANGKYRPALANTVGNTAVKNVAIATVNAAAANDPIEMITESNYTFEAADLSWDTAPTTADAGKRVFLSASTAGQLTLTPPSQSGEIVKCIGYLSVHKFDGSNDAVAFNLEAQPAVEIS